MTLLIGDFLFGFFDLCKEGRAFAVDRSSGTSLRGAGRPPSEAAVGTVSHGPRGHGSHRPFRHVGVFHVWTPALSSAAPTLPVPPAVTFLVGPGRFVSVAQLWHLPGLARAEPAA